MKDNNWKGAVPTRLKHKPILAYGNLERQEFVAGVERQRNGG